MVEGLQRTSVRSDSHLDPTGSPSCTCASTTLCSSSCCRSVSMGAIVGVRRISEIWPDFAQPRNPGARGAGLGRPYFRFGVAHDLVAALFSDRVDHRVAVTDLAHGTGDLDLLLRDSHTAELH